MTSQKHFHRKLGVNPPGNTSLNTKQFGLALIAVRAVSEADPAPVAGTGTTGQVLAPPAASAISPTSLVVPPSAEKIPPLLVGFLK